MSRSAVVTSLATTPVKGMRVVARSELALDRSGVRNNRRFYLVDHRGRMVNGKHSSALTTMIAGYDNVTDRLTVTFPDGAAVTAVVRRGEALETRFFSLTVRATRVLGPWSEAISDHAGQPLRLVEADPDVGAIDRGSEGSVTLISRASIDKLAAVGAVGAVDSRRFRMLIELDGLAAHEEDGWVERDLRVGTALVRLNGHVGRCAVTTLNPESGRVDFPTLDVLRSYRGDLATTEPLAFGVYGNVLEPGVVRVGDRAAPE